MTITCSCGVAVEAEVKSTPSVSFHSDERRRTRWRYIDKTMRWNITNLDLALKLVLISNQRFTTVPFPSHHRVHCRPLLSTNGYGWEQASACSMKTSRVLDEELVAFGCARWAEALRRRWHTACALAVMVARRQIDRCMEARGLLVGALLSPHLPEETHPPLCLTLVI